MKYFLKIIILLSVISSPYALASNRYIDLDESQMHQIEYYTGCNIKFYNEYKAKKLKNMTSFPLQCCDPLPVYSIGELKVFFSSAIEGHISAPGQGILIPDSEHLTEIIAIRGKAESNGHWVQAYIGYDPKDYKALRNKKVYKAHLLAIQTKNPTHTEEISLRYFHGAQFLSNSHIELEVRKHLNDPKDWDWNNERFLSIFRNLIPSGDNFYVSVQNVYSNMCYWTKEENKLKQRKYLH
ncbi:MAG: hypothetical protein IBJ00_02125 [Alphaproteobacteria bacterium]|nr:hypothetical protein [Alphaproteobacteria bacterium]